MRGTISIILVAAAAVSACSNRTPGDVGPRQAPPPAPAASVAGCGSTVTPVGTYNLAFTMQGTPVDMVLAVRRDPDGALAATTRSMGTRVDARRVTLAGCALHIDLDPSVAGEGQIDLTLSGDAAAGTLTWQGQPTTISGKRAP